MVALHTHAEICGIEYCSHEGQENPDICTNRPYFTCEGCGERRCKTCRYYFNVPIPAPMSALGFTYSMFCPNCKNTFGICCSAEHVKECKFAGGVSPVAGTGQGNTPASDLRPQERGISPAKNHQPHAACVR